MGVCGLALMGLNELQPVDPALNLSTRTKSHMMALHERWRESQARRQALMSGGVRNRSKSGSSTFDRNHMQTVVLAFAIGLGSVFLPWFYKVYMRS